MEDRREGYFEPPTWEKVTREDYVRVIAALQAAERELKWMREALRDFIRDADWYRRCLEDVNDERVVRRLDRLDEAKVAYDRSLDHLAHITENI